MNDYLSKPDPDDPKLTRMVTGMDHTGAVVSVPVVEERTLTLFLNSQEIVTLMTIGDHPAELAVGYLLNQNMIANAAEVTAVDVDEDLGVVVVRTTHETDFEVKTKKKIRTSGCAMGTMFGDVMERFEEIHLPSAEVRTSWIYALTKTINTTPSLYLKAGAIHGSVLCQRDRALLYMEDVGRHNAVDKVAGYMALHGIAGGDKIFYTTGRLTSEMVIKTVLMGIPILISRSGFTASGVELATRANLTLIGRARGRRFTALAGIERIVFDAAPETASDEPPGLRRKAAGDDW